MIDLTSENYYSKEANMEYMSVSQFKAFNGTYGRRGCEAQAMAELKGEWLAETTTAMMIGSYVDAYFEGTLPDFKDAHPEIYKRDGKLKADYIKAEEIIKRAERDKLFMECLNGEKQVIMVGEIGGVPWKIKIDSYIPDTCIVDLKVMQSLTKLEWVRDLGYLDFVQYWNYDIQGAVYQEIVRQNTGKRLPFLIAGLSKEKEPDIEIINIAQTYLNDAMETVKNRLPNVLTAKNGERKPVRCGCCDYCRHTKVLTHPIGLVDLAARN